ncbi:MAG TPA: glycosyltransferase family 4 protein [Ohtaekwangia sp.]|uniref:glycosyltransferase n=1 Tax=Ohtaekwangia sp. TaxID=2066019 RepID=UPI002F94E719
MEHRRRTRIFTWHIHGSYLYYLSQCNFDIYIPLGSPGHEGYIGRGTTFPFGANVIEVPANEVRHLELDCILFQTNRNYLEDQYEVLSQEQRSLPAIYLEHDPPQRVPTNTPHVVNSPLVTLVHVTSFNALMWDNNDTPTTVIDHGVIAPDASYTGEIPKGIVVINNLSERGRRLGYDIFLEVRKYIPLDLIGMNTEMIGGLGEVLHPQLPAFVSRYRFFFNPIRYTSLGLAVLEAMMIGIPVVGLATTEMVTVIRNDESGYLHTDIQYLINKMRLLLKDNALARRLGEEGKRVATGRFSIQRFVHDWEQLVEAVIARHPEKNSMAQLITTGGTAI